MEGEAKEKPLEALHSSGGFGALSGSVAPLACVDSLGLGCVGKPGSVGAIITYGCKLLTCSPKQLCHHSHLRVSGRAISVTISSDSMSRTKIFSPSCSTK